MLQVAPSMLSADFAHLARDVKMLEDAGAAYLHIDVMDGMFVPNLSFGAPVIKSIRGGSKMIFDTHLMIMEPLRYIDDFVKAGSDLITIHYEATDKVEETLRYIRSKGVKAGLSIKPATEPEEIEELLPLCDLVLVMSVEPGFGGQKFMPDSLRKLRILKEMREKHGLGYLLEVDGGIGTQNAALVGEAGAQVLVAGSAVFGAEDPAGTIRAMMGAYGE